MRIDLQARRQLGQGQKWLLAAAAVVVGYALLRQAGLIPGLPCPWRTVTGYPCPLCGMTSTLIRLLHGDVAGAISINPLDAVLALVLGLLSLAALVQLVLGRGVRIGLTRANRWTLLVALLGAAVLNWAYLLLR